jgi:choline-sulfatase
MEVPHRALLGPFALAAVVGGFASAPWRSFPTDPLGLACCLALVLLTSVALALPALAGAGVARLLRRRPRALFALGAAATALSLTGIEAACRVVNDLKVTKLDFEELYADYHAPLEAGLFVLGVGALLCASPARVRVRAAQAGTIVGALCGAGAVVALVAAGTVFTHLPRSFVDSAELVSLVYKVVSASFDGDGDRAPRFAGIDCDDDDPLVNPMQAEIPDNGKDDNCLLGDGRGVQMVRHPPAPLAQPVRRVIVFMWDALRADHLALYGYARETAPFLTSFSRDAFVFRHVSSSGGMTRTVYAGLTSGQYQRPPPEPSKGWFKEKRAGFKRIDAPDVSFLQSLAAAGVDRFACILHIEAFKGFADGYTWSACPGCELGGNRHDAAPLMLQCAQDLVGHVDVEKPSVILVHVLDAHARYNAHPDPLWKGRRPIDLYDGEILYADGYVRKVMELFEEKGLLDDAAVVMTADHGEAFGEHGRYRHGYTAYDETNRVPLLIRLPGRTGGARIDQPVENGDLAPTIRDLLGVDVAAPLSGASLVPLLEEGHGPFPRPQAMGFAVRTPDSSVSLVDWPWKAIWDRHMNLWELHDLAADPAETRDVSRLHPDVLERMQRELALRVERYRL